MTRTHRFLLRLMLPVLAVGAAVGSPAVVRTPRALAAPAPLAPGLFHGHPPPGRLSPLDRLTLPPAGRPRGYVLLVHGGAWLMTGSVLDGSWYRRHGWATYAIDYRPGSVSVVDTVRAYDHLRARVGPGAPICAYGESAGGMLVMLLAASRPSLGCVIAEAGIADIRSMEWQCAYGGGCGGVTPAAVLCFNYRNSDPGGFWEFSPVRVARYIRPPLLMAGSSFDPLIDERAQLAEMKRARPKTMTMLLPGADLGGTTNFTHASVSPAALQAFGEAELRLLARVRLA